MKRTRWLLLLPLLAGCGADDASADSNEEEARVPAAIVAPTFVGERPLALVSPVGRVRFGDPRSQAFKIFPKPEGVGLISELPPGFANSDYRSEIWQTTNEAFGILLYGDRVALAMRRMDKAVEEDLLEKIATYRTEAEGATEQVVAGRYARYWFWERDSSRLMVSALATPSDGYTITIAVGDKRLMDRLGMAMSQATIDANQADNTISDFLSKRPSGQTSPSGGTSEPSPSPGP